jgi:hypothetical protein
MCEDFFDYQTTDCVKASLHYIACCELCSS